jgi:hypothetical protein
VVADPLATYDQVFEDAGREWNVDPTLIKAVAMQESRGNPRAVSKAGAQGLMQIMPRTQKQLGMTDAFDPVQSIFFAAKLLSQGLDKEGTPEGALLFYHGGSGWRQAYGPESKAYVPGVAAHYQRLAPQPAAQATADTQAPAQAGAPQAPVAPPVAPQDTGALIIGDSLASKGGMGGSGVVGASPKAVLASINTLPPEQVAGRDVVVSGGASNSPKDVALVEQQVNALNALKPRSVTVVGVGDRPDLAAVNPALAAIANRTGARFLPLAPGQLSRDRIHPTRTGYNALLASALPRQASY